MAICILYYYLVHYIRAYAHIFKEVSTAHQLRGGMAFSFFME